MEICFVSRFSGIFQLPMGFSGVNMWKCSSPTIRKIFDNRAAVRFAVTKVD